MSRRTVIDWLAVTAIGLGIGAVMAVAVAGWVWYRDGVVTAPAVESQLLILSALVLLAAGTVARPFLNALKDASSASRPYRSSFGILLLAGGLWGLMLVFFLDAWHQ